MFKMFSNPIFTGIFVVASSGAVTSVIALLAGI